MVRPLFVIAVRGVHAEFFAEHAGADPPHVAGSDAAEAEPFAAGRSDEEIRAQAALDEGDIVGAGPVFQRQRRLVLAEGDGQRFQALVRHEGGVDIDVVGCAVAAVEHDVVAPVIHDLALHAEARAPKVGAVVESISVRRFVVEADVPVYAARYVHREIAVGRFDCGRRALHLHPNGGAAVGGPVGAFGRSGGRGPVRLHPGFELAPQELDLLLQLVHPVGEVLLRRRRRGGQPGRHEDSRRPGGNTHRSVVHSFMPFADRAAARSLGRPLSARNGMPPVLRSAG